MNDLFVNLSSRIKITQSQQQAIHYISKKFYQDKNVLAFLISGSIAHGFHTNYSDVDFNAVITNECYKKRYAENQLCYYEDGSQFYQGCYFDGIYISVEYLSLAIKQGNEPTRFALHDAVLMFDRTGIVADYIVKIGEHCGGLENAIRFLAQFEVAKWLCGEGIAKESKYLIDVAVQKLILFGGRLILNHNKVLYPHNKWFLKALESAKKKPEGLLSLIDTMLTCKTQENILKFYEMIKNYHDWAEGRDVDWGSYNLKDVNYRWMHGDINIDLL